MQQRHEGLSDDEDGHARSDCQENTPERSCSGRL